MLYIVMRIALPIDTSRKNGRIALSRAVSKKSHIINTFNEPLSLL